MQFCCDVRAVRKSFCFHRLAFLAHKFNTHKLLNELDEMARMTQTTHRDFYNIRKVRSRLNGTP